MVFVLVQFIISANPTEWSNILKQFVVKLPANCLDVFDHFVRLALKKDCVSNHVHKTNQIIHLKTILKLQHGFVFKINYFFVLYFETKNYFI